MNKFWERLFPTEREETAAEETTGRRSYDLLPKIFCVFAAICMWFYVINAQTNDFEQTFSGVEIRLENTAGMANGLAVVSGYGNTAEVVLSGKRSDLNKIRSSDIIASVDLGGITSAGEYPLNVSVDSVAASSVRQISPSLLYVYVDKTITKTVEVRVKYTGGTNDVGSLSLGTPEPSKKYISVTGPEEEVLKISGAVADLSLGIIDRSVRIREKLTLVDDDGIAIVNPYIRLSDNEIDITVPVYMIKELPLVPQYRYNIFDQDAIACTITPETVTVRGEVSDVEGLTEISTDMIDDTNIGPSCRLQLGCVLPHGVTLYRSEDKCTASLAVKDYKERRFVIPTERIEVSGLPDNCEYEFYSSLYVTGCGPQSVIDELTYFDFSAELVFDGNTKPGSYADYPVRVRSETNNVYIKENGSTVGVIVRSRNDASAEAVEE